MWERVYKFFNGFYNKKLSRAEKALNIGIYTEFMSVYQNISREVMNYRFETSIIESGLMAMEMRQSFLPHMRTTDRNISCNLKKKCLMELLESTPIYKEYLEIIKEA